jgi:hypothetical protein
MKQNGGMLVAISNTMLTMLLVGFWACASFAFCLAITRAAARPVPHFDSQSA